MLSLILIHYNNDVHLLILHIHEDDAKQLSDFLPNKKYKELETQKRKI